MQKKHNTMQGCLKRWDFEQSQPLRWVQGWLSFAFRMP